MKLHVEEDWLRISQWSMGHVLKLHSARDLRAWWFVGAALVVWSLNGSELLGWMDFEDQGEAT